MLSSIASGWNPNTSSSSEYSSLFGLDMSSQNTHPRSATAPRSDATDESFDVRPSAYLMNARSIRVM